MDSCRSSHNYDLLDADEDSKQDEDDALATQQMQKQIEREKVILLEMDVSVPYVQLKSPRLCTRVCWHALIFCVRLDAEDVPSILIHGTCFAFWLV